MMSTLRLLTRIAKCSSTSRYGVHQLYQRQQLLSAAIVCGPNVNAHASYTNIASKENGDNQRLALSLLHPSRVNVICNYEFGTKNSPDRAGKSESKASAAVAEADILGEASKLGLFAKFKLMYKKYWYVLIPVHVVTSLGWFGGFYYLSKSGVDVPALLQYIHLSETIIQKVQGSEMGHLAIAYLCYKVATPIRYAVTLGGTTVSIKYLVQMGYIKPMPSKKEIIQIYEQKKADRAAAKAERMDKERLDQEKERQDQDK